MEQSKILEIQAPNALWCTYNKFFFFSLNPSLSDLQIFSSFADERTLIELTTHCDRKEGEIFNWDKNKIRFVQASFRMNVNELEIH